MGKTHSLVSIMLLCICLVIPIDLLQNTVWLLKENILFFIVGVIVLAGGALLPDLDNSQSSAGSTLGFMGSIVTIFMQSTSSIIWTLMHSKRDRPPMTPHRYFWHTLVASFSIICLFLFGLPNGNETILQAIRNDSLIGFLTNNIVIVVFIFMVFMAVLCGSNMVLSKIIKFFNLPKALNYICPVLVLIYIFTLNFSHLRVLGICIGLGYLFHCIEDFFADSGVPLLWPIPIAGHMWFRCKFPITCQTGGIINTMIDFIVLAIDIILIVLIILKGTNII